MRKDEINRVTKRVFGAGYVDRAGLGAPAVGHYLM